MLGSWFARQQGGNEKSRSLDDTTAVHDLNLGRASPPKGHASPHDTILSQLHPTPKDAGKADSANLRLEPDTFQPKIGMSPSPSTYTGFTTNLRYNSPPSNVQAQPQRVDLLLDPYDGSTHGALLPHDTSLLQQDQVEASSALKLVTESSSSSNDAMWSHLSKVLDLQGQIAKMHVDMEGIGSGDGKRNKGIIGSFRSHARLRARAMSNVSNLGSSEDKGAEEDGVGVDDGETEENKLREEQFTKLADQFEGKKESIRQIMNKLDDLSQALTEFHALKAPNIDASSRRSSVIGISSNPSPLDPSTQTPFPPPTDDRVPLSHASLPPFPTLWSPPKTPFSTTSPKLLPPSFSRVDPSQTKSRNPVLPTVLTKTAELEQHPHVFESPASAENLQLHPE